MQGRARRELIPFVALTRRATPSATTTKQVGQSHANDLIFLNNPDRAKSVGIVCIYNIVAANRRSHFEKIVCNVKKHIMSERSIEIVRFNVTIETIGEQGSPLHWIVQTIAM